MAGDVNCQATVDVAVNSSIGIVVKQMDTDRIQWHILDWYTSGYRAEFVSNMMDTEAIKISYSAAMLILIWPVTYIFDQQL